MTLAISLKKLGYHVVFHARIADAELAQSMGIEIDLLSVNRFPRKLQDFRFFRRVDRLTKHLPGTQIALCRVRSRDIVICGGTHRGYLALSRKRAGLFDWLQIWMETKAYSFARRVVAHSNLCHDELVRRYQVPTEKIVTLYPPVDSRFSSPQDAATRAECRRQLGLPANKTVLLFPSLGHSRKGLHPICRALREIPDSLVLAVAGKPPKKANWPFVHFLGYLKDMAPAYRAADFTILGSSYEPFGMVGPESLLCGTRLIFEENIGCLAGIKSEFVLTFSVWDPESIRRAVKQALCLARDDRHHLHQTAEPLRYDPSPEAHATALLQAAIS